MIIDLSNIIKISLNNFYWYDLFKQLNVTIFQTNVPRAIDFTTIPNTMLLTPFVLQFFKDLRC